MSAPLSDDARKRLLSAATPLLDEQGEGARVSGRYRLIHELGRGGMGVVWQAFDEELGRDVALKVLDRAPGASSELRERFLREARAAARLSHPGIAAIYDADERAIAMQLVRGEPLSSVPAPEPEEAARWIRDAARAVHYAHENGVVHRDLKPHNLLLEADRVLVTDFGLAKDALATSELSHSGSLLGTPAYMAPEQARGGGAVDARADVWGLGATLYDLVCGRPPFVGTDVIDVLRRIGSEAPPAPTALRPTLPRDLELVIQKALALEPERRYPSARALADDLHRWLEGQPVLARAPSLVYRTGKFAARHRLPLALAAVSVLALAVATATWFARRAAALASDSALAMANRVAVVLDDAEKYQRAGEIERAHERLDVAIAAARELVARHDSADGHVLLGRLLVSRERRDEARAAFDRALELQPDMVQARVARGLLKAREVAARTARRDWMADAGKELEAEESTLDELRAAALSDLALTDRERLDLRRVDQLKVDAESAALGGELERSERLWKEILRLDEVHVDAKLALREIELARGDADAALTLAMSALDVHRGLAPAYVARGGARSEVHSDARQGEWPRDLPAAGEESGDRVPATVGLRVDGLAGMVFDLAPLLAARPSDALAHGHRGQLLTLRAVELAARGDADAALDAWDQAIAAYDAHLLLEPSFAVARNNRGVAHFERARLLDQLGRASEVSAARAAAARDFDDALVAAPHLALARLNRALLRVVEARPAEAREDLVAALGLTVKPELRARLERELSALDDR